MICNASEHGIVVSLMLGALPLSKRQALAGFVDSWGAPTHTGQCLSIADVYPTIDNIRMMWAYDPKAKRDLTRLPPLSFGFKLRMVNVPVITDLWVDERNNPMYRANEFSRFLAHCESHYKKQLRIAKRKTGRAALSKRPPRPIKNFQSICDFLTGLRP